MLSSFSECTENQTPGFFLLNFLLHKYHSAVCTTCDYLSLYKSIQQAQDLFLNNEGERRSPEQQPQIYLLAICKPFFNNILEPNS